MGLRPCGEIRPDKRSLSRIGILGVMGCGGGGLVLVLVLWEMQNPHQDRHKAPASSTPHPPVPTHKRVASPLPNTYPEKMETQKHYKPASS